MSSHELEEAKQVGRRIGREIGRERVRQGAISRYVDEAREALALRRRSTRGEVLADAIRLVAERLGGDEAGLLSYDCDAIGEALDDAGLDPEDREIRKAAREAAADACDDEVAGAIEVLADDLDEAGVAHMRGIEGGIAGAIADLASGASERAAAGLDGDAFEVPDAMRRAGIVAADLEASAIASMRSLMRGRLLPAT